jgi:hypothetical protein
VIERPNHYLCLGRTRAILESLLEAFRFSPIRDFLGNLRLLSR